MNYSKDGDLISLQRIREENVESAVFKALEDIHASRLFPKKGMKILIKPNILSGKPPERAVTTHPLVLQAVIRWVKQFSPERIIVCDSSGGRNPGLTEKAMRGSGIKAICEKEEVECFPFEKSPRKTYHVPSPLVLSEFISSSLIDEADLIINLPKIKTHELCTLTCCIKNIFGTVLLGNKAKMHTLFPRVDEFTAALVDIYSVVKPQLTVIDGYYAMEGFGPAAGDVVKWNLILAGYDGLALDRLVCKLTGLDHNQVLYLEHGAKKGIGSLNLEKFIIKGEALEHVYRKFKPPKKLPLGLLKLVPRKIHNYAAKILYRSRWQVSPEKCRLCGTCWQNCPVEALTPPNGIEIGKDIPIWDGNACITCYCCTELCPYEAIQFKVPIVRNFLFSKFGAFLVGFLCGLGILIALLIIF
ncbi:MAG: DUF362 domain-containing protein [Candidatus Lokiarchaeota archaeon]|nr:DUF362 domain-containing protein [Candidatus Harpocratesius repetitus]